MSQSRLTCPASPSALRAGATQGILLRSKSHVRVGLSLLGVSNPPKLQSASEGSEGGCCAAIRTRDSQKLDNQDLLPGAKSVSNPKKTYVGSTSNPDHQKATALERYLKS